MTARVGHRFGFAADGRRWASLRLVALLSCLTCACSTFAQSPGLPPHIVPAVQQAARDSDRVEILRQELKKSEALLESLARRTAERLAAADPAGVNEAEAQRARTASDIAGLKRELAAVTRSADATPVPPALAKAPTQALSRTAPWWDVYGKARRTEPLTPVSMAPAGEAGPRPVSARRLE